MAFRLKMLFKKNMNDDDTDDNFVAVFPSNHTNKFIDHAAMISEKNGKYPFVTANTDSSEKGGETLVEHTRY